MHLTCSGQHASKIDHLMSPSLSSQTAPQRLTSPWYRLLDHPPLKVWSDVLASNDQMPCMAHLCFAPSLSSTPQPIQAQQ
ncbi:hypothetical protein FIBSPDRAFT_539749 [Athelia psychrophila]|uniref:Uncharacterized protein n=1 Tax=Athelia psychrophila TaxID=1759441 RepID=A0A166J394_9AGAM|nr:hypothetical protein FIBSPDRAFT_539749 [Fibularhizoctonia sp. CBS 109695]